MIRQVTKQDMPMDDEELEACFRMIRKLNVAGDVVIGLVVQRSNGNFGVTWSMADPETLRRYRGYLRVLALRGPDYTEQESNDVERKGK